LSRVETEVKEAIGKTPVGQEQVAIEVIRKKTCEGKKVQAVTSFGYVLAVYETQGEAARRTGISVGSISNVCLGKYAHAKGFKFVIASPEIALNQLSLKELQDAKQAAIERGEEVAEKTSSRKRNVAVVNEKIQETDTADLANKRRRNSISQAPVMSGYSNEVKEEDSALRQLALVAELQHAAEQSAKEYSMGMGSSEDSEYSMNNKKVQVVTLQGRTLAVYESLGEAARKTSISKAIINEVCLGQRTHAKGFMFRHASPEAVLNQLTLEELYEIKQEDEEGGDDEGGSDEVGGGGGRGGGGGGGGEGRGGRGGSGLTPGPKARGKLRNSCNACTRAKKKCDGGMPCGYCLRWQDVCIYQHRSRPGPVGKKKREEVDPAVAEIYFTHSSNTNDTEEQQGVPPVSEEPHQREEAEEG